MNRAFFEKYCPDLLDKGFEQYIHIGASNHVAIRSSRILDPDIPELFAVNAYKEIANLLIKVGICRLDKQICDFPVGVDREEFRDVRV